MWLVAWLNDTWTFTNSITIYSTEEGLHINVRCRFNAEESITKVHELISKIEDEIRDKFGKAIVTIRPEPTRSK